MLKTIEQINFSDEEITSLLASNIQPKPKNFKFVRGGSDYICRFSKSNLREMLRLLEESGANEIGTNIDVM